MTRKYNFILILIVYILYINFVAGQDLNTQDSIWKSLELEDLIITAQYTPTHYKSVVHKVKVITADDIKKQGHYNLSEVLANQMNLRISVDPILGNGLRIQGLGGENVQIMIDGVPIIGRTDGNIDLSQILLYNIERIEIIEGALSTQYGSNASGGVINLISRKSQTEHIYIESQNLAESVGILNNSLGIGFRHRQFSGRIHGSRVNYNFVPIDSLRLTEQILSSTGAIISRRKNPWNPKLQHGLNGNLNLSLSDSLKAVYQYSLFNEVLNRYGEVKRPIFKPYAFDETYTTFRQDHSLLFEWYPNERAFINSTTAFNTFKRLKGIKRVDFADETETAIPAEQDTALFNSFLHRTILSSVGGRVLNFQAGVEIFSETGSGKRLADTTSEEAGFTRLDNYAAWLGIQYEPASKVKILANVRYGHNTKYIHPVVPSLNVHWQLEKNFNLRLGYAYGFRAPSLKELYFNFIDVNHFITGNSNLEAEYSHNASFAIDYDWFTGENSKLGFLGKVFYNKVNNRIVLALLEGTQYSYQNIESFETQGMNFGITGKWKKRIEWSSTVAVLLLSNRLKAAYEAPKFTNSYEWRNLFNIEIPYIKTNLVITHNYFSKQILFFESVDGISEGFINGYHMANFTLSKSFFMNKVFLSAGVKNVFDVENIYFSGMSGIHGGGADSQLIGWGRSYFMGVNVRLGRNDQQNTR